MAPFSFAPHHFSRSTGQNTRELFSPGFPAPFARQNNRVLFSGCNHIFSDLKFSEIFYDFVKLIIYGILFRIFDAKMTCSRICETKMTTFSDFE